MSDSVTLDDGSVTTLADLSRDRTLILIFLRHLQCTFCQMHVAQLRKASDLPIVFVAMASQAECAGFRKRMRSPHPIIADPTEALYEQFRIPNGSVAQLLNPTVAITGLKGLLSGHINGIPKANPKRLGGWFVIRNGKVLAGAPAKDAADLPSADDLKKILLSHQKQ